MAEKKKLTEHAHGVKVDAQSLVDLGVLDVLREFEGAKPSEPDTTDKYDRVADLTVSAGFNSYTRVPDGTLMAPYINELFAAKSTWEEEHVLSVKFDPPRLRPRFLYAPAELVTNFGLVPSGTDQYSIGYRSGPNAGFVDLSPAMSSAARGLIVQSIELGEPLLASKILEGLEGMSEAPQV